VVRLDGRKLTAPLLAQAVAFAAVLVIGGLTGHGPAKLMTRASSSPTSPATHQTSPATHQTSPATHQTSPSQVNTSTGDVTELTVQIVQTVGGVPLPTVVVKVFRDDRTLTPVPVVSIILNQAVPETTKSVPVGHAYQVCAKPPRGWTFTGHGTGAVPGSDCIKVGAGTLAQTVTFQLNPPSPSIGGLSP
jgi:hypothetical protein